MSRLGLTDGELRAIGEVTVEAAALEGLVAYVVAVVRDRDDQWLRHVVSKPGQAGREFEELVHDVAPGPLLEQGRLLLADIKEILAERHRIVHSVFVLVPSGNDPHASVTAWHARTDTHAPFDADAASTLADRLAVAQGRLSRWTQRLTEVGADYLRTDGTP